jgi:CubicO group peptidase (beta-lactamase class C family)
VGRIQRTARRASKPVSKTFLTSLCIADKWWITSGGGLMEKKSRTGAVSLCCSSLLRVSLSIELPGQSLAAKSNHFLAFPASNSSGCGFMRMICSLVILAAGWVVLTPAYGDVSVASCVAAQKYSVAHQGLSLLVIQDGHIIHESYAHGDARDRVASIFSGTKGFWCLTAIAAQQDGLLDLDEPVKDTITEWANKTDKQDITIRNLLNFTAGIEPVFALHGRRISDRNRYSIALRAVEPPGESFMYGPSELQIFSEVLRRKLLRKHLTLQAYIQRRILTPLGIYGVDFREDDVGHPLLASGFKLSAREWVQLGILILNDGKYGHRQIVPGDMLKELFRGSRANPIFGMGFWLNRTASDGASEVDVEKELDIPWQRQDWHHVCLCRDAPRDLIAAIGSGYQRMFIIPSMDLIIVRQGRDGPFSDATFLRIILGKQTVHRSRFAVNG